MASRLTLKQRIQNAGKRGKKTLNLSFTFDEIDSMMKVLNISDSQGADVLSHSIVSRIVDQRKQSMPIDLKERYYTL